MTPNILIHYLQYSQYTSPSVYENEIIKSFPDEVREIGLLVRKQLIHRMTLQNGNTGSNEDLRYGDMIKVPWNRQPEDDIFVTASAMISELYRRDPKGFTHDRSAEHKLILACRHISVLMAAILKAKKISARVRSGFAPYFVVKGLPSGKSDDHWINQYFNKKEQRWVTIDVDGSFEELHFDPYDIPSGTFDFAADVWIGIRNGTINADHFWNAGGNGGLIVVAWELFYDFHCLMNDEVIYTHTPKIVHFGTFEKLTEFQLKEIDNLAKLMQNPDKYFDELLHIWETKKQFRLVKGGLI